MDEVSAGTDLSDQGSFGRQVYLADKIGRATAPMDVRVDDEPFRFGIGFERT